MELAKREGSTSDNSLPDPAELPFAVDEMEFLYELWTIWAATGKRYLPSQLIQEYQSGRGRILTGLFDMDVLFEKTKAQLKGQRPPS
jgi:hypothetical protein